MTSRTTAPRRGGGLWWLALLGVVWVLVGLHSAFAEPAPPTVPAPSATPRASAPRGAINCHQAEPSTHSPWLAVARADAQHEQIDVLTFLWQIEQESGYQPDVVSKAGAIGIAQFMPETAQGYGINPWDPKEALDAAARDDAGHLRQYAGDAQALFAHYGGNQARYDYALALAAYNAGPGALESAWRAANGAGWPANGAWAWLAEMAGETQHYVPNILGCSL